MENVNVFCSRGKEKLLNEEYLSLPQHHKANRNTKDKIYVCMLVIAVTSCIVSCVCAGYCYSTLAEMKKIKELNIAEQTESDKEIITATERLTQSTQEFDVDSSIADVVDLDYDFDEEFDDSQLEDSEHDDDEISFDDTDNEGSGDEEIQNDENLHERIRRADVNCEQTCAKKTGNKLKRCIRKCQRGGKRAKTRGKTGAVMNLPSAQFEVKFTDKQIQNTVKKGYNEYVEKDNCAYVEELDGVLCLDRHYLPKNKNVPLDVFKPSTWFDEKTSPVTFSNARAITKTSGIYLVYAQAYIGGKEASKSIRLVQKHNNSEVSTLSCRTGVHPDLSESMSGQLQTCSVLGLLKLEAGDTVEVQKGGDYAQIILDKDKTYFGIVQLSTFATPRSKIKKKANN